MRSASPRLTPAEHLAREIDELRDVKQRLTEARDFAREKRFAKQAAQLGRRLEECEAALERLKTRAEEYRKAARRRRA